MVCQLSVFFDNECMIKRRPAFHDSLDFISVQEKLLEEFRETFSSLRGKQKQSLDGQVDAVIRAKATRLKEEGRKGLLGVCRFPPLSPSGYLDVILTTALNRC